MRKVLILEDDPEQREMLHLLMGQCNFWSKMCPTVESALNAISTGSMPDVIVADYYLPTHDGLEFVKAVRRLPGGERPGIILVTAADRHTVQCLRGELKALKVQVIFKPYEPRNLVEQIERFSH